MSRFWSRIALLALIAGALALGLPLLFAGSPDRLASGTRIAGVDVGGLTTKDAERLLAGRAARLANVPVTFIAGTKRFQLTAAQLGVSIDWKDAVETARNQGGGFGPIRGLRRLSLEFFPENVVPPIRARQDGLDYELDLISASIGSAPREARLVRHGLHISIAAGSAGRVLDKQTARQEIVDALASFSRAPVTLPVRVQTPAKTVQSLTQAQRRAATIVSAPVTLIAGKTRYRVPRWRLATLLDLSTLRFSGSAADTYFASLQRAVEQAPKDAAFAVAKGGKVRVVPAESGVSLDVARSAAVVLAAAARPTNRVARLVLTSTPAARTTAQAEAMGITGIVGSYETVYGGDPNRIHNVELVSHLVDGTLIAPGATFSFNGTTGERSAAKGFLEAPVIVNGELQTGLGGGVCQVSTTVFNAAYEAGLRITARTNHALYISHYPLGRDATVDYPDIDLKFVNDTPHWLLLRTYVNPSSLSVVLYGTPQHRRIETIAQPLRVVGPPPVQKTVDATLDPGEVVVDDPGVPAQSTSVERKVYDAQGSLLSDETWYSSYRAEPKIVRVGPKKKKPKTKTTTTTTTTTTTSTTTAQPPQSPPATTTVSG
ncbi:MAG TPA: VanW family protein [Gaiellaceae bacterium]|nr:VanW family protein [Gaiellaceae bacterium]